MLEKKGNQICLRDLSPRIAGRIELPFLEMGKMEEKQVSKDRSQVFSVISVRNLPAVQ